MNNSERIPFEKNRYYYGKMLTSEDFTAEQRYVDGKRAFINQLVLGRGILCGMQVYNLDDLSVLVESGAAIDACGREIVVGESAVQKLSALRGYDNLQSDKAELYIRYREEQIKPVYVANHREDQDVSEHNRISEEYELYLEEPEDARFQQLDSEFFVEADLLKHKDLEIRLRIPAKVCRSKSVRMTLEIWQKSKEEQSFSIDGNIWLPALLSGDGEHELHICEEGKLKPGETKSLDYWIYVPDTPLSETHILIKPEDFIVHAVGQKMVMAKDMDVSVYLTDEEPQKLVGREAGKTTLELLEGGRPGDGVRIAVLHLKRTKTAWLVKEIEGAGDKDYIPLPSSEKKRQLFLSYYGEWEADEQQTALKENLSSSGETGGGADSGTIFRADDYTAKGVLEIPLEAKSKKGQISLSDEIIHGLGPGRVYVMTGVAASEEGAGTGPRVRTVTYGDMSLFAQQDIEETWVETAVRVYEDKGSFQVAARVKGEQKTVLITIPWMAFKIQEEYDDEPLKGTDKAYIAAKTPTVRLKPKEKHFFEVEFHNISPCQLAYSLVEEKGGRIEADGMYTAPVVPGVYEIQICLEGQREVSTYAYAVVERERTDET